MSIFHDKMLQDMQLRGFSPNTQRTYLKNLQQFEKFSQKPAQQLSNDDLRGFNAYWVMPISAQLFFIFRWLRLDFYK